MYKRSTLREEERGRETQELQCRPQAATHVLAPSPNVDIRLRVARARPLVYKYITPPPPPTHARVKDR